jgi:H/ACA ribonucleoprotein complex subunit 4
MSGNALASRCYYVRTEPPWETKRAVVRRCEESTDQAYGCNPHERPVREHIRFGIINLDKPAGPSSHEVTAWAKNILGVKHAGHGGTLEASPAGKIP